MQDEEVVYCLHTETLCDSYHVYTVSYLKHGASHFLQVHSAFLHL